MIEEKAAAKPEASAFDGARVRPGRLTPAEWLLLLILGAVQFTNVIDFVIVMPLGPQFMRDLEILPRQFGVLVSVYGFTASLAGLLAAWFIDRFDRKKALLFLYGGFTVGTLLCAVAPNYSFLVAARAVTGGFGGIMGATILAIIGDVFPDSRRGTATGVVMSAFSVASILGVPAGLYLANLSGWPAPFWVLGGLSLAILFLVRGVLPPLRGHLAHGRYQAVNPLEVLRNPNHIQAYVLMTALVMSTFMVIPYIAAYAVANVGRQEPELPYIYLCGGATTLVTLPLVGRLSDRFGKLLVFRILVLLALIPTFLITNLPPVSLALVLVVSTLFMVTTSGRMVPAMAMITACSLPRYRGSFMSINASVQHMASGLASLVGAALLHKTEDGTLTGFSTIGVLAACAMVLSAILAGRLRPADIGSETADAADGQPDPSEPFLRGRPDGVALTPSEALP
jgi:predicted MFS family arabinose efflux permease